jgi:putative hydrolase of the HAD superfamily
MKRQSTITSIFTDIGGVLLTNGWDRGSRRKAIEYFKLDDEETEERHHLCFDTLEVGKITLDEYFDRVVFYKKRSFTPNDFWKFICNQSQPLPHMLGLMQQLKKKHRLKIVVISNEGRELAEYRIKQFKLDAFVDFFIISSFVHFRKPDADIFRIAIDIAQVQPKQVVYLEDRPMFVQVAGTLGIHGIRHLDYNTTRERLAKIGLR